MELRHVLNAKLDVDCRILSFPLAFCMLTQLLIGSFFEFVRQMLPKIHHHRTSNHFVIKMKHLLELPLATSLNYLTSPNSSRSILYLLSFNIPLPYPLTHTYM